MPTMQRWRRMPARSLSGPSSHEPKKRRASAGSSYPTIRDIPSPANRSTAPSGSSSWRLAPRPDAGKNILARISDQNIRARLQRDFRLLIDDPRSEEHTSELQSLMRISYAVFCLKKKNNKQQTN